MKKVCKHCGSENVVKDAWASWDGEQWVLEDFFDDEFCKDCDGETTIIDLGDDEEFKGENDDGEEDN